MWDTLLERERFDYCEGENVNSTPTTVAQHTVHTQHFLAWLKLQDFYKLTLVACVIEKNLPSFACAVRVL